MLDALDYKIVNLISKQGRMSWSELAQALGLSAPSTADRVRRLEEKGIIKGYTALIDYRSLGYDLTAFIFVTLGHPTHRALFLKAITDYPEILECHHITGEDDYLLKVRCHDTTHLDRFLNEQLKLLAGVSRTRTTIALSTSKDVSSTEVIPSKVKENV